MDKRVFKLLNKFDKFVFIKKMVRNARTEEMWEISFMSRSSQLHHSCKIHSSASSSHSDSQLVRSYLKLQRKWKSLSSWFACGPGYLVWITLEIILGGPLLSVVAALHAKHEMELNSLLKFPCAEIAKRSPKDFFPSSWISMIDPQGDPKSEIETMEILPFFHQPGTF
jgi:hypothetical protein